MHDITLIGADPRGGAKVYSGLGQDLSGGLGHATTGKFWKFSLLRLNLLLIFTEIDWINM